jgi:hypothetical protein
MRAVDVVLETLAHFIKQEGGPPPGVPAGIDSDFERRLVRLCEWHGLAPLFLDSLQRLALESPLSEITRKRLQELNKAANARNDRILGALQPLVRRLRERRIPFLLVDDVMTALTVYPRHRLRPMEKLDVLIRESDWDRFIGACRTLGYRREAAAPNFADGTDAMLYHQHFSPCVLHGAGDVTVGVKFRLVDVANSPKRESAWDSGKRIIRDVDAPRVSFEDQLVRSCVGFAMSGFGKLLHAVDAGRIIARRGDDMDWSYIERVARERSFYPALYVAHETISSIFNFPARRRVLPSPGALRKGVFDVAWRPGRTRWLGERPPGSHRYRFCFLENGTLSERFRVFRSVIAPRREWVSGFFDRPANPWLRAKFAALAFRYKLGSPVEGGEGARTN